MGAETMNKYLITEKVFFEKPLTPEERSYYLLLMATDEEVKSYLAKERKREQEKKNACVPYPF